MKPCDNCDETLVSQGSRVQIVKLEKMDGDGRHGASQVSTEVRALPREDDVLSACIFFSELKKPIRFGSAASR